MDLSYDEFVDILASFRTPDRSKDAGDKRRTRRIGYRAQLFITLCKEGSYDPNLPQVSVLLRDVSSRGASLLCDFAIERGQSFVLHLKGENKQEVEMLCSAIHCKSCRPANTAPFQIGAEFICQVHPQPADSEADIDRIQQSILG